MLVLGILVAAIAGVGGCVSYLAYARMALWPGAEAAARDYLSGRIAGARDDVLVHGVRSVALSGVELAGVSGMTLRAQLVYEGGVTGAATLELARVDGAWGVASCALESPAVLERVRGDARKAADLFLDAMRGGDWRALSATLAPELVARVGEAALRAQLHEFTHNVEEVRFADARTRAEPPRYAFHGLMRTSEGPPQDVDVTVRWRAGALAVADFRFQPSAAWLAEQRNVARQVALNFVSAMKSGVAADMMRVCHPRLVEALTPAKFDELAADFVNRLADITFDDARTLANHPVYDIRGVQKTQAGTELPASVRVQYIDGQYLITALRFE